MSFRQFGGLNYAPKHNIVASNYNTSNNLLVTQNVGQSNSYINFLSDISGDIIIYGNLDVSGNLDVTGNVDVNGNTNIGGNLDISGNTNIGGNLDISGNTNIDGSVDISGNTNIGGNLDISGNTYIGGNVDVSGNVTANYMFLSSGDSYSNEENAVMPKSYIDLVSTGINPVGNAMAISTTQNELQTQNTIYPVPINTDVSANFIIDGVIISNNDAVILNDQGTGGVGLSVNNGVYYYINISPGVYQFQRSSTQFVLPTGSNAKGAFVSVLKGLLYATTGWLQTYTNTITNTTIVGTDHLSFVLFYTLNFRAGQGLNVTTDANTTYINVNSNLDFINFLDSSAGIPNATGTLSIGTNSTNTIIGPTGGNPVKFQSQIDAQQGITGPTGSFTNVIISNSLDVSGVSFFYVLPRYNGATNSSNGNPSPDPSANQFITRQYADNTYAGKTSISTALSTEISSRISGDSSLSSGLSTEISSRISGDSSLSTLRLSGDNSLSTALSTEISSRISADSSLSTAISTINTNISGLPIPSLSIALSTEISQRISGDSSLSTALSTEISQRISGDSSLSTALSTEISQRISGDSSLSTALSNEISQRISGDVSLTSVGTSLSTALSTEISSRISGDSSLSTALSSEVSSRISGDSSLSSGLSTEISSRISGDTSLSILRLSGDSSLSTALSTEISQRISGDTSLSILRLSGDSSLSTALSTEISSRISGDTSLSILRLSGDTSLSTALSTEISQRISGDTSLSILRLSGDTSLSTALSTEISSRISGDTSLSTVISSTTGKISGNNTWTGVNIFQNNTYLATNSGTNVGIETTSPAYKLDVNGNGGFRGSEIDFLNSNGVVRITNNSSYNYIQSGSTNGGTVESSKPLLIQKYYSNATPTMFLDIANNRVGINKSTTPTTTLDVNGNTTITGTLSVTGTTTLLGGLIGNSSNIVNVNNNYYLKVNGTANLLSNTTGQGTYIGWNTKSAQGRSDFICNRGTGGGGFDFWIQDNSGNANVDSPIIRITSGGLLVDPSGGNAGLFVNRNRFTVNGSNGNTTIAGTLDVSGNTTISGNVGIGTSSPAYKLDVSGDTRLGTYRGSYTGNPIPNAQLVISGNADGIYASDQGQLIISGSTDNRYRLGFMIDTTNTVAKIQAGFAGTSTLALCLNPGGGTVGIGTPTPNTNYTLDVNGSINATSCNTSSDYRIKENVQILDESYNIDNLKPVTYLNKKLDKQDIGLIAHELQKVFPCLVTGEKDGVQMQSVNYTGLIPILIKEIQDLKKEVKMLKERNL